MIAFLCVSACGSGREIAYINDAQRDSAEVILHTYTNSIHPYDQLYIYVNSANPEAADPFNQKISLQGYIVDESGYITLPILGKIVVSGFPIDSVQSRIEKLLIERGYVNDPVVTVNLMNFRVSVIGEVRSPQELHLEGERLTIFEALAQCGDVTGHGMRDNVLVVRDMGGTDTIMQIDLTQKSVFESQAYYLQNNDIVYVEPTKKWKRRAYRDENVPQYISLGVSLSISLSILILLLSRRWDTFFGR